MKPKEKYIYVEKKDYARQFILFVFVVVLLMIPILNYFFIKKLFKDKIDNEEEFNNFWVLYKRSKNKNHTRVKQ